jgi:DNA-directed RNA polymerase subunit RPC12/RpoP
MPQDPLKDAEIEVVCPRCGYRMTRTASRLRRPTRLICAECGQDIMPEGHLPEGQTPEDQDGSDR